MTKHKLIFVLLLLSLHGRGQQSDQHTDLRSILASNTYPNIDGVIISHNEQVLFEEYFNGFARDSLHDTRSSFKSITSLLAGIAIDKGLFRVDDEIEKYVTEWENDPRGKITVKDLLEMKSGLACEGFFGIGPDCESNMWETNDWLRFILHIPLRHDPGLNWAYTSMEPELIGIIISRTSGLPLMEFAKQHLFQPLDIEHYEW